MERYKHFHEETPEEVRAILLQRAKDKKRIRIWFGDTDSGRVWLEEYDVMGYVGFSMGPKQIPILLANSSSDGGGPILDHCIVRIDTQYQDRRYHTVYQHPLFWLPIFEVRYCEDFEEYDAEVVLHAPEGQELPEDYQGVVARFKTNKQAMNWAKFMTGKRYSK